jgi:hypothetical protein
MTAEEYFARLSIPVSGDFKHGTIAAFADRGCRCLRCCGAFSRNRDAATEMRGAFGWGQQGSGRVRHGTINAYNNRGCRCDECKAAGREYYARRNHREAAGA